jgi:ribosomal protein L7/L12
MDELQIIQRLAIIEAQLLLVSQHLGIACPPFPSTVLQGAPMGTPPAPGFGPPPAPQPAYVAEVIALARAGKTIDAIKLFRASTGASLVEAKEAVEKIV